MNCVWKDTHTGMCRADKLKYKRNCRFLLETRNCPLNNKKFCGTDKNDKPVYKPVFIRNIENWWYGLSQYRQDQVFTLIVCGIIFIIIKLYIK